MNDKVEFIHYSYWLGPLIMKATNWKEAVSEVSELYNQGIANSGKCKVVKRTYKWVSDEPQILDTYYK